MIDFKKYKRFFSFGCSMTQYYWPTWADIIGQEIPEFYNYGRSGAGNLFIASQIAEAHHRHKFCDTDLIICMWSSITREDRYLNNSWQTPGNIYTQNFYSNEFVEKYADVRGYLLRDLSLISLTQGFLDSLKIDYHMLNMMSFRMIQSSGPYNADENDDIFKLFEPTITKIKPDIATIELKNRWPQHQIYHNPGHHIDYHPSTKQYFQYLKKVFPNAKFSDNTVDFVEKYETVINSAKDIKDISYIQPTPERF